MSWFKKEDTRILESDLSDLRVENSEQTQELFQNKMEIERLNTRADDLKEKLTKSNENNKKLNQLVRDQTGADLLVNALQELGMIPKDTVTKKDHYAEAARLQTQYNDCNQLSNIQNDRYRDHRHGFNAGVFGGLF